MVRLLAQNPGIQEELRVKPELADGDFPHRQSVFVRTLERLPVRLHPKA
jgi:hypothetical protein